MIILNKDKQNSEHQAIVIIRNFIEYVQYIVMKHAQWQPIWIIMDVDSYKSDTLSLCL